MIVLDSSGSVFGTFENGLKFVRSLIDSLTPTAIQDGRIQVLHLFNKTITEFRSSINNNLLHIQ